MSHRAIVGEDQKDRLRATMRARKRVEIDARPEEDVSISLSVTKRPRLTNRHVVATEWDWRALRDCMEQEMAQRGYPREERPPVMIAGICKGFIHRHGAEKAERIVRSAFSVFDGVFAGIPVTFQSLCANSDPHFALPMLERLDA